MKIVYTGSKLFEVEFASGCVDLCIIGPELRSTAEYFNRKSKNN